jgi:16S rRNA (guanine966-N2)-methyltransferase
MPASGSKKPGSVRIIGGEWRRRRIEVPAGVDIRPTPDRVRETLFNWLAPVLPGASCLDLYAGTGALAFEALSRGAARAVLVERDRRAVAALESARDVLGAEATIVNDDALAWLARSGHEPFDIVFVDPPYADAVEPLWSLLPAVLGPGARVYLERERGDAWPGPPGLEWTRRGTAGAVAFGLAERLPSGR